MIFQISCENLFYFNFKKKFIFEKLCSTKMGGVTTSMNIDKFNSSTNFRQKWKNDTQCAWILKSHFVSIIYVLMKNFQGCELLFYTIWKTHCLFVWTTTLIGTSTSNKSLQTTLLKTILIQTSYNSNNKNLQLHFGRIP